MIWLIWKISMILQRCFETAQVQRWGSRPWTKRIEKTYKKLESSIEVGCIAVIAPMKTRNRREHRKMRGTNSRSNMKYCTLPVKQYFQTISHSKCNIATTKPISSGIPMNIIKTTINGTIFHFQTRLLAEGWPIQEQNIWIRMSCGVRLHSWLHFWCAGWGHHMRSPLHVARMGAPHLH